MCENRKPKFSEGDIVKHKVSQIRAVILMTNIWCLNPEHNPSTLDEVLKNLANDKVKKTCMNDSLNCGAVFLESYDLSVCFTKDVITDVEENLLELVEATVEVTDATN